MLSATQLISGVLLMAANKFRRNESIRLGDGTQGKVVEIGLLETTIVGMLHSDDDTLLSKMSDYISHFG